MIRMVNHSTRSALPQRHVQRSEHQLGAQMGSHRPAHNSTTPRVQHHRQVQETGPRRDVGDVGHPELIGSLCREVTLDEILRHAVIMCPTRRLDLASSTDAPQTRLTHQPRDTLETHMGALLGQLRVYSRHTIRLARPCVDFLNPLFEDRIDLLPNRRQAMSPCIVAAG